jgi:hypothetical protein
MTQPSGHCALWGSNRLHHRYVEFTVCDADGRTLVEAGMSFEQFADMLTGPHDVPCTLGGYAGEDGMPLDAPAPDPVSIRDRLRERVRARGERAVERINKLLDGERTLPKWIQQELAHIRDMVPQDVEFAAQQAEEELSAAAESALTVASGRIAAALASGQRMDLLSPTLMLAAGGAEEVDE